MPIKPTTGADAMQTVVGGFTSISDTPWMTNVQCEACHGPGANHAQNPLKNKMRSADEKGCLVCHTKDTDPEFDFHNKFQLIKHGQKKGK